MTSEPVWDELAEESREPEHDSSSKVFLHPNAAGRLRERQTALEGVEQQAEALVRAERERLGCYIEGLLAQAGLTEGYHVDICEEEGQVYLSLTPHDPHNA